MVWFLPITNSNIINFSSFVYGVWDPDPNNFVGSISGYGSDYGSEQHNFD